MEDDNLGDEGDEEYDIEGEEGEEYEEEVRKRSYFFFSSFTWILCDADL